MALNNSISKQQFSFSKSDRFPGIKSNTKNVSGEVFNKTSDFDRTKNWTNSGFAFGSHQKRFNYYNHSSKHGALPSPVTYTTQPRTFSPDVSRSNGWSMGQGRGYMKKDHIDRVLDEADKKVAPPCPTSYEKTQTFGAQGLHYTMSKKMYRYGSRSDRCDPYYFDCEKKLPGPGYYAHPETIGSRMMSSTYVTSRQSTIPQAKDRFRAPTVPKENPAPDQYQPKADIVQHVKSNHPRVAMTKFGLDKSDILDSRWGKKAAKTTPGPGSYNRWSDFSKTVS